MSEKNSTKNGRGEMEVYGCKVFILYMSDIIYERWL